MRIRNVLSWNLIYFLLGVSIGGIVYWDWKLAVFLMIAPMWVLITYIFLFWNRIDERFARA